MDIYNAAPSASNVAFEPDNLLPNIFQPANEPDLNTTLPSEVIEADAFANVDGYSKVGLYTGNGNADGTFVYTGFRPAFIMVKSSSATGHWEIHDTTRDVSNVSVKRLFPNYSSAEDSDGAWDILSNSPDNGSATATASTNFNSIGSAGSNNMFHYSNSDLMDGLKVSASYVPSGTGEASSSTDWAVEYTGVEGLTLGYAQGENNATAGSETDNDTMYVKYAYGPVTVGYQESEIDAPTATDSDESQMFGISYAVTDSFSIAYNESEFNLGSTTTDQSSDGISASYTMGGITVAGAMNSTENIAGDTNTTADKDAYEMSISFAF